ncbi:MAG: hypothetical protein K2Y39_28120 [Candidatus Obscuribacterales bacterium]|nr:hypothetical protein [Candidatus Obscuribacterales bacterium]
MSYHSSFTRTSGTSELPSDSAKSSDNSAIARNFDYYRFNGDGSAPDPRRNSCIEKEPTDLQLVDASSQSPYAFSQDDLRNAKSTAARLTALERIASSGEESFKFRDKDGAQREFRVETQKCGEKTLIHCYAKDSRGSEQVVMRAVRNASGEIEQQRNAEGKLVSYYGDNWSRSMQGRTFLVAEKPESERAEMQNGERRRQSDKRGCREQEQNSPSVRVDSGRRENESKTGRQSADRGEERDVNVAPRLDVGRALAEVASIAAPFLMAQLNNRGRCNDLYPFTDYPRRLPERGCGNYYDGHNRHYYDSFRHDDFWGLRRQNSDDYNRRWGRPHHSGRKGYNQSHCR